MEVAVVTRRVLLLEAHHFATMEHTSGARVFAIARDDRVKEHGGIASILILAVNIAPLYLELDAVIIGSAVLVV